MTTSIITYLFLLSVITEGNHTIFRLDAHYSQTYLCAITK